MNPGGIRAALASTGDVRYEDIFAVQPFYNNLVTMTLTGAQLATLLEQQWLNQPSAAGRVMQVSRGFGYTWDASKPAGQRVVPGSLRLNGAPIAPEAKVRVTVNNFMAGGGDNFVMLRQGTEQQTGIMDIDAFEAYVRSNPGLSPGALDRITRLN
jgi:5'-nucleotidase